MPSHLAKRHGNQIASDFTSRFASLGQCLPRKGLDDEISRRRRRLPRFWRIAIERGGIVERHTHPGFIAFRADTSLFFHSASAVAGSSARRLCNLGVIHALQIGDEPRLAGSIATFAAPREP